MAIQRNTRLEYLVAAIMLICFEQFVFHQWRIYDYDRARQMDYGVYDRSNVPLTRHNEELFLMLRTEVNFTDFAAFVSVDVSDVVRDKKANNFQLTKRDLDNFEALKKIDESTVFTRSQFRQYLARYFPERIRWTGIHPVYNDTMERDTHRYYWASKMAKDFVIATGKEKFTGVEINQYFEDKSLLNYLNLLILEALQTFETFLIETGKIREVFFTDQVPYDARFIPPLMKAKRMMKFIDMDSIYFQFASMVNSNSSIHFKEDLSDFDDFRTEEPWYQPILDPESHPIETFSSPDEPYLIYEESYDNETSAVDRVVRRTPLSRDNGRHDNRHGHVFQTAYMNNTFIKRGIHITVRDIEGNLISNEFGPKGPLPGSPEKNGKVLWYVPNDRMHEKYIFGEENLSTFVYPRPPTFDISHYDDYEKIPRYF